MSHVLSVCLFRILLPLLMITCVVFRPSALSGLYLILALLSAFLEPISSQTMRSWTGFYLKSLIAISVMGMALIASFHTYLVVATGTYGAILDYYPTLEIILRYCGLVRLDGCDFATIVTWVSPEPLLALTSSVILVLARKLVAQPAQLEAGNSDDSHANADPKTVDFVVGLGKYVTLILLCVCACLEPSVQGGLYFLVYIGCGTWLACSKELGRGFAVLMRFLMLVVFAHIMVLFVFQIGYFQEFIGSDSPFRRYFAISFFYVEEYKDPRIFVWQSNEIDEILMPFMLLVLFFISAWWTKELAKPKPQIKPGTFSRLGGSFNSPLRRQVSQRLSDRRLLRSATTRTRWHNATRKVRVNRWGGPSLLSERTPLMRGISPSRRYGSDKRKTASILQDSTGSVTVNQDRPVNDTASNQDLGEGDEKTCFESCLFVMEQLLSFVIQISYVATNIIMMTWSITYHSWLTFVLLIWANVLWILPKQRRAMLRSSPVLVFYAIFLLLSGYVFSMNLTDDELPASVANINLAQFGFVKVTEFPCRHLLTKCLFTVMFWVTLRQYTTELKQARQRKSLAQMAAPLQVTVGTAAGVPAEAELPKSSQIMKIIGEWFQWFFVRSWIWVVAVTLFAVAITGERMTVFRILYMALFLFFILTFQLSFDFWRKMMFTFLLIVIIYSMLILILIYTYQFDNFGRYWTDYLHVPPEQQLDIGLETYKTTQLFVRLATPTCFIIVTAIQLHLFHKDFLQLTDASAQHPNVGRVQSLANSSMPETTPERRESLESDGKMDLTDIGTISSYKLRRSFQRFTKGCQSALNYVCTYLEIQMHRYVLLIAALMCIYDKCALSCLIVPLVVIGLVTGRNPAHLLIRIISVFTAMKLLSQMVYQVEYIHHSWWDVDCLNETGVNNTQNTAEWLGFHKSTKIASIVEWNIGFIAIATIYSVVLIRQYNQRIITGQVGTRPFFVFRNIKRFDADKNVKNALKFLCNHGYYKFGYEISLIATVGLIGIRMDMYALCYAVWLCILSFLRRDVLRAGIWTLFLLFIVITIPIQYALSVGLVPNFCIEYPWDDSAILRRLQEWAFLIDTTNPPNVKRLICDFILLTFVARQRIVFRIEERFKNREYPGGSNDSIIYLAESKTFINPIPDFITYVRSYLDIFKRVLLLSFMWITLAALFLAGTNRVNIFSVGYLMGTFIFLWQGTELYLKPLPNILRSWNCLIAYTVIVIFFKAVFQLVGCVWIGKATLDLCWVVQLLGISCLDKFGVGGKTISSDECNIPKDSVGLVWDGVCFTFLIMQRRLFNSYNFFHIIDETKASTILASRGADLIEVFRQKRMAEQAEREKLVLEKIKAKMDRIKATQEKIQGPTYQEINNHFIAASSSASSCVSATSRTPDAGYHTPVETGTASPAAGSSLLLRPQATSPYSAVMTVSLEGYLEPRRVSFGSPRASELDGTADDNTYPPVFSPPPSASKKASSEPVAATSPQRRRRASSASCSARRHGIGPSWMGQSVVSGSSRSPASHHTYTIFPRSRPLYRRKSPKTNKEAIRSGDYYMFDELDDDDDFEEVDSKHTSDEEDEDEKKLKRTDLSTLLSNTLRTDINTVVRGPTERSRSSEQSPSPRRRTASMRSQAWSAPPTIDEVPKKLKKGDTDLDSHSLEPHPSTSKQGAEEEVIDEEDEDGNKGRRHRHLQNFINVMIYIWKLIDSAMVSLLTILNKYSKDFRYVRRVLVQEKKILKESTNYTEGIRMGRQKIWKPAHSYQVLLTSQETTSGHTQNTELEGVAVAPLSEDSTTKAQEPISSSPEKERRKASVVTVVPEIRILAASLERGLDTATDYSGSSGMLTYDEGEISQYDQPTIVRLVIAIWYIIISNSDILCYVMIFLNQMKSATFMSLPLPMLVFFWGTLTIPRPTKSFWVTIIAYTQIIVLVKCIFQFEFWPWNPIASNIAYPYYPPQILGVEQNAQYAVWDLLVLLVVYFHRFLLKSLGLWTTSIVTIPILEDGEYVVREAKKADKTRPTNWIIPYQNLPQLYTKRRSTILQPRKRKLHFRPLAEEEEEGENEQFKDQQALQVTVKSDFVEPVDIFPETLHMSTHKYSAPLKDFIHQLRDPTSRASADVYSYMFLCDFFNFFVILIGYTSFGEQQGDGGVSSYIQDNRVPHLFLLMLILQFLLIIVDRAIFLRKNITSKIVFQFIQIIVLHSWLFILFPIMTDRYFNSVIPPQMYYMVKCFYLLLSAYQIRCGYPSRILGNFLCKSYNYVNKFLFQGFMLVPFLFELRTVMDWMWTDTSMTVFDWIKMEDIFATIFQIKCVRRAEMEYPQPRGEKKKSSMKYVMGGFLLFVIIAIIWFPLVFFSLGNAVGQPNVPYDVTLRIRIGPYEPVYQLSAQANSIFSFTDGDLIGMQDTYKKNKPALTFINNYQAPDIAAIKLSGESSTVWTISPPDRARMIKEVNSSSMLYVHLQYSISHKSANKEDSGQIRENVDVMMPAEIEGKPNPERMKLLQMLYSNDTDVEPINLGYILPKFVKVTNRGTAEPIRQLMDEQDDPRQTYLRSLNLTLSHSAIMVPEVKSEWWTIVENCSDLNYKLYLRKLSYADDCSSIVIYTFNDRIFPATLSIITAGGIIGVYTTLVFVASRVLRGFFSGICFKIMFDDMPNVDRVLQLCHDIYLVREASEFALEEDLFAKLVFLFRSPETLVKWTRPKEEVADDDDPEGDS